jgi:multidrug resistance efflux pump
MSTTEFRPAASKRLPRRVALLSSIGLLALLSSFIVGGLLPGWSQAAKPTPPASEATSTSGTARSGGKASCFGFVDVEQGIAPLYPVQLGRVTDVFVHEGARVEAGQPLFRIDDALAKIHLSEAKTAVGAAENHLAQAKSLKEQHKSKIAGQEALIEIAKQEAEAARSQFEKADELYQKASTGSKEDIRGAKALVAKAEAGIKARQAELEALKSMDPQIAIALAEHELAAKRADLDKAELGLKECTVTAPSKGIVLRLGVSVGEILGPTPRHPALMFCPDAPRIVRAEVEQEFADHVATGQAAAIIDDATSEGSWTGKVVRLSDWYTQRRSVLIEPLQYNDVRTLECIIELAPGQAPLRIGQRVRVMIGSVER